jgi:hypothetical protein
VKFTTLIPKTRNDGNPFPAELLKRVIDQLWKPFGAMSEEGEVIGRWTHKDGTVFSDVCIKISIECDRERLQEAIRAVRKAGKKLGQHAMYFEVTGYDGIP